MKLNERMLHVADRWQEKKYPVDASGGLRGYSAEVAQLEAANELYKQRIVFEQACRFADAQHDYDMAAYALRDLSLTQEAELADLAQSMQSEGCCKGDWVGLRDLWDKAYREALGVE